MNLAVEIIPVVSRFSSFLCSFCTNVCLSKGELNRYTNTKYHLEKAEANINLEIMLQPDIFYQILSSVNVTKSAVTCGFCHIC